MSKPRKPKGSRWGTYEIFYTISGAKRIGACSPEEAVEKFCQLTTCELAEEGKLETLDPVRVGGERMYWLNIETGKWHTKAVDPDDGR